MLNEHSTIIIEFCGLQSIKGCSVVASKTKAEVILS